MLALIALLPVLVSAAAVDMTARDGVDGNAPLEFKGYKLGDEVDFPKGGKGKFVGNKDGKSFFQFDNGEVYDVKLAKGPSLLNDKGYVTVGDDGLCNGCTYNGKRSLEDLQTQTIEERQFRAGANYVQQAGACGAYGQCGGGGGGGGGFIPGGGGGGGGFPQPPPPPPPQTGGGGGGGGGGIIGGLLGLTAGYLGGTVKLLTGGLGGYPSGAGITAGNTDLNVGSNGYVQVPGVAPGSNNGVGGTYVGDNSGTQLWQWENGQVAPLNIQQGDRQDVPVTTGAAGPLCEGCSDPFAQSNKRSIADLD